MAEQVKTTKKASGFESDGQGYVDAINRSQAVIEFTPDGTIITANDNFLGAVGYSLDEIKGKHHRMFCEESYAASAEYRRFWESLRKGEFDAGEYKRIRKDGEPIWIQASYNPVFNDEGLVEKVVKFASDITEQKLKNADFEGQLEAIGKSQAVIEFDMDGTIRWANDNFLNTVGYALDEIKGSHHRMFAEPDYAASPEYAAFWQNLNDGNFDAGEYKRLGKGGKEIWIQASYNPIFDPSGKPYKVVKYASDITAQKELQFEQQNQQEETQKIFTDVSNGADQLEIGAQQIASSSQSLASGASEQAASLEEISASLEELSSMTTQNADNAVQATTLSEEAQSSATKGQSEMQMMTSAMDEIKASSSEISKIIKVIDEIAFQTNLLALNAAVEAARAGEAGKGFAVVADEVRNLAQRSAEAAKNTSSMIEESTQRADNGVAIAARVGEAFEEIVTGTQKVNTLLSEISSSAKEQSSGIGEINSGVTELDKVTQQNAGNAEELASAAQETAAEVSQLRSLVNQFKIKGTSESSTNTPVAVGAPTAAESNNSAPAVKPSVPQNPTEVDFMEF